jgi:hypothetical protein
MLQSGDYHTFANSIHVGLEWLPHCSIWAFQSGVLDLHSVTESKRLWNTVSSSSSYDLFGDWPTEQFVCDICDGVIVGVRFHSTASADFDVCSKCTNKQLDETHKFARIDCNVPSIAALNHVCDACNKPISGTYFHCRDCANYDECDACRTKGLRHNRNHVMDCVNLGLGCGREASDPRLQASAKTYHGNPVEVMSSSLLSRIVLTSRFEGRQCGPS